MPQKCMSYSELSNIIDIDQINSLIADGTNQVSDLSKIIDITTGSSGKKLSQAKINELTTLFEKAKQNCKDAPGEIKTTEKNLLVYEHGQSGYEDIMLERYKKQASKLKREMMEKSNEKIEEIKNKEISYIQKTDYLNNMFTLLKKIKKENAIMKSNFRDQINSIEINDRKTYYEEQQNGYASWWSKHLANKYFIMIILFIIAFVYKQYYKEPKYWFLTVLLFIFPFLAKNLLYFIYMIYQFFYKSFKNVYLYEEI